MDIKHSWNDEIIVNIFAVLKSYISIQLMNKLISLADLNLNSFFRISKTWKHHIVLS